MYQFYELCKMECKWSYNSCITCIILHMANRFFFTSQDARDERDVEKSPEVAQEAEHGRPWQNMAEPHQLKPKSSSDFISYFISFLWSVLSQELWANTEAGQQALSTPVNSSLTNYMSKLMSNLLKFAPWWSIMTLCSSLCQNPS